MNPSLLFFALIILLLLLPWLVRFWRLREYRQRLCQAREWKRTFPNASKQEIRQFLQAFIEAFALPNQLKLQLSPEDKPLEIYRKVSWLGVDSFEFEQLSLNLEKTFGMEFDKKLDDSCSLGDVFALIGSAQ